MKPVSRAAFVHIMMTRGRKQPQGAAQDTATTDAPAVDPFWDSISDNEGETTDESEEEAELIPHEAVSVIDRPAEGPAGGQEALGGADGGEEDES